MAWGEQVIVFGSVAGDCGALPERARLVIDPAIQCSCTFDPYLLPALGPQRTVFGSVIADQPRAVRWQWSDAVQSETLAIRVRVGVRLRRIGHGLLRATLPSVALLQVRPEATAMVQRLGPGGWYTVRRLPLTSVLLGFRVRGGDRAAVRVVVPGSAMSARGWYTGWSNPVAP